jgi:hypothetical protein
MKYNVINKNKNDKCVILFINFLINLKPFNNVYLQIYLFFAKLEILNMFISSN